MSRAYKRVEEYRQGTNVVLLEPDAAAVFHDADSVNRALRMLIEVACAQNGRRGRHRGQTEACRGRAGKTCAADAWR